MAGRRPEGGELKAEFTLKVALSEKERGKVWMCGGELMLYTKDQRQHAD